MDRHTSSLADDMRRMQFMVESASENGCRRGRIAWGSQSTLSTPLCLTYTRAGAVPHLTKDVLEGVLSSEAGALLPLPSLYEVPGVSVMTEYNQGIHNFTNRQDQFVYLSVQDPPCPPNQGYNEEKNVSVWCKGGRRKINVMDHLKFVETLKPNVFEALCDSISSDSQKMKRMRKSVDRTIKFLDETIAIRHNNKTLMECGLLGAIEGSDILEERKRSAQETAKRPVDGFVLEGFDLVHNSECLKDVLSTTTPLLPSDKPRFIHGLHTPEEIFIAIECGVDVFDGSYPYTASERGAALVFNVTCHRQQAAHGTTEIHLAEERYSMDFSPLVSGCTCYSCLHHTRAYINHLLLTNEILARVLLMLHNMTHYLLFFKNLREALDTSTYALFKEQCTKHS